MLIEFIFYFALPAYGIIVTGILLDIRWKDLTFRQKRNSILFWNFIFLINAFFFFTKGVAFLTKFYPLMVQLPLLMGFYPVTKYKGYKLLFIFLTAVLSAAPIVQLPPLLTILGFPLSVGRVISRMLLPPLLIHIIYKWFSPRLHYALACQQNSWGLLCVLPLVSYLVGFFIGRYNYAADAFLINASSRIGLIAITYAAYIVIFMFFKQSREYMLSQSENRLIKLQSEQALKEMNALRASQRQISIYRHDLRHHMNYLHTCITEHKLQEASDYIRQTCNDIEQIQINQYSLNEPVNLIVSACAGRAKEKGITFNVNISTANFPQFQITDLCSLLSNSLENALTACGQPEAPGQSFISLRLYEKNNKTCLELRNSYSVEPEFKNGLPVSHKNGHGIGVKSMVYVVEKYHGIYRFSAENGVFTFQMSV